MNNSDMDKQMKLIEEFEALKMFCENNHHIRDYRVAVLTLARLCEWKHDKFVSKHLSDDDTLPFGKGIVYQMSDKETIEFIFYETGLIQIEYRRNDDRVFKLQSFGYALSFIGDHIPNHEDSDVDELLWKLERTIELIVTSQSPIGPCYNPIHKK